MKTWVKCIAIILVCLMPASCKSKPVPIVDGSVLYNEVIRIKIQKFRDAVDLSVPTTDRFLVNIEKIEEIDEEIRGEIGYCYIYGKIDDPDGIYFGVKNGSYYISLKDEIVPWQIQNYTREKIANNIYKIYR